MSEDVIDRIHQMAKSELQPKVAENFRFEWRLEAEEIRDVVSDKDEVETEELLCSKERPIPQIMEIDEGKRAREVKGLKTN